VTGSELEVTKLTIGITLGGVTGEGSGKAHVALCHDVSLVDNEWGTQASRASYFPTLNVMPPHDGPGGCERCGMSERSVRDASCAGGTTDGDGQGAHGRWFTSCSSNPHARCSSRRWWW
jgi:hypothetical protein